jgi:hypothetical protein
MFRRILRLWFLAGEAFAQRQSNRSTKNNIGMTRALGVAGGSI